MGFDVEFEIAGDVEPRWIGNEGQESLEMVLVLNAEEIKVGKKPLGKRGKPTEPLCRSLRHFAADKGDVGAVFLQSSKEVRPKVTFNEDELFGI